MDPIYARMNFVKQLIIKNHPELTIDIAKGRLDHFLSGFVIRPGEKRRDAEEITFAVCRAYAKVAKMLHENNGTIREKKRFEFSKEIVELDREIPDDPNNFLAYFTYLIKMDRTPLTAEELKRRFAKTYELPEFEDVGTPEERRRKESALLAAYSVLSAIIEKNAAKHKDDSSYTGEYEDPDKLIVVEGKTYYESEGGLQALSADEKATFEEISAAKKVALKNFLPTLLLKAKGEITPETIRDRYEEILEMLPYGDNTDFRTLVDMERIYQAVQLTLAENGGRISTESRAKILTTYERNIPKVRSQAAISMIFNGKTVLYQETIEEYLEELARREDGVSEIDDIEGLIDIEIAYCILTREINRGGGMCNNQQAREVYRAALDRIEQYKEPHRREMKSPFKVFPRESIPNIDSVYLKYLKDAQLQIEEASSQGDIEGVLSIAALAKVQREAYDIVSDPDKRRELEEVSFEVDQSGRALGNSICEIQYVKELNPTDIMTLENSVGDEIIVTRTGKLGFGAMRQPSGKVTYGDPYTTNEYLITKVYHSRAKAGEPVEQRDFTVFSKTILASEIEEDPILYSVYANQIFSDLSLEAACEKNWGTLASGSMIRRDGKMVPEIYFDSYTLDACRTLKRVLEEYEAACEDDLLIPKTVKRTNSHAVLGNANVRLKDGYGTKAILHVLGGKSENDTLHAFEWSDIRKRETILDAISGRTR